MTDPTRYTATTPDGVQYAGPTPLHAAARVAWAVWTERAARQDGWTLMTVDVYVHPADYCGRQYVRVAVEVTAQGPQVARVRHPVTGLDGRPTQAVETVRIEREHWGTP